MSSSSPPQGHIPIIPDYKWSRHSEEVADRNASVSSSGTRPLSRELGYNGFPTTAEGWAANQTEATERVGRTRHRPARSIDVLEYARLRPSQDLTTRPKTLQDASHASAQTPPRTSAGTAVESTESPVSRFSFDTSAEAPSERPVPRGNRLRHYISSLAHWPGQDAQPLFDPAHTRRQSNTSQSRDLGTNHSTSQRPATSDAPQQRSDQYHHGLMPRSTHSSGARHFRSRSLDAKRTLHFNRQRQSPPPPLPATRFKSGIGPAAFAPARPNTHRPTRQADVIVPARSSSLGPQQSLVPRKPLPSASSSSRSSSSHASNIKHSATSKSIDPQRAALARKAGVDLSDSTQTHVHTTVAPAVTQETVRPVVHEIRKERITRDVHNTHIVHRVLPIKHTEHLPARHFVRTASGNDLREVDEADVPSILGFA